MRCDHSHMSPRGTVVRWSFVVHDGSERRWYETCRACGRTLAAGRQAPKRKVNAR